MSNFESPIPLSEIESVLEWVDGFKLSRPTKKINRDFSDAVLLAEILSVHYPKLVEMHNYPPRNSHSLKLNNWLTLNRKVLKKLKLNLCINTMEQLANCHSGVIERVLVMVREKIRRDEDLNKTLKDSEQNMSSGGSFYEACGEDENILVVPVKVRVNGVLETVQQKVVNYDSYLALKEELSDAKDSVDVLKQKVEHLDNLLKLKDERIEELQKQLDRKQARRKEAEAFQNSLQVPFETIQSPIAPSIGDNPPVISLVMKTSSKSVDSNKSIKEESKIPIKSDSSIKLPAAHKNVLPDMKDNHMKENGIDLGSINLSYTKFPVKNSKENPTKNPLIDEEKEIEENNIIQLVVDNQEDLDIDVDKIKSDVFKEIEIIDEKVVDFEEFEDSEQGIVTTIEQTIKKEIKNITNHVESMENLNSNVN